MAKKIIIGIVLLGLAVIGIFVYKNQSHPVLYPEKNLGSRQMLNNQTGQPKTIEIKQTGYYDITTISGDDEIVAVGAPLVGETLVGQFFKKDDTLTMLVNGKIQLKPAKLEKFSGQSIELKNPGSYYVGTQIPVGTYQIKFVGELTNDGVKEGETGVVQLNVKQLGADDDQTKSYILDNHTTEQEVRLKKNEMLTVKSNGTVSLILTLNK